MNILDNPAESQLKSTTGKVMQIKVSKLYMAPELQSRAKMLPSKVLEYSNAIKNGVTFPPVLAVRDTNGIYRLIDGWHRVQAHRNCDAKGTRKIDVEVIELTADMNTHTLRFMGAMRNAIQGLPLSPADKHVLFKDYIKSKNNLDGRRYKTYREIAADLCSIPFQTIARWMKSDFPSIASKMGRDSMEEQPSAKGTGNREIDMPDLSLRGLTLYSLDILEQAKQARSDEVLDEYINHVEELADCLRKLPRSVTPPINQHPMISIDPNF
jgi:hypothetical protein